MWDEVKDGAYKKLQGNMKRRSGTIGISPRAASAPKQAAPAAAKPAAGAAAKPAAAKPSMPMAAPGKNMSEDKLARLMSIRAANAAKAGGSAPVEEPADEAANGVDVTEAPAEAVAPVVARPASSGGLPFSAENLMGGVPENTVMAEDKIERLKSIRSGNLERRG